MFSELIFGLHYHKHVVIETVLLDLYENVSLSIVCIIYVEMGRVSRISVVTCGIGRNIQAWISNDFILAVEILSPVCWDSKVEHPFTSNLHVNLL